MRVISAYLWAQGGWWSQLACPLTVKNTCFIFCFLFQLAASDIQLPKSALAFKKSVQRHRAHAIGHVAVPQTLSEVPSLMPEQYRQTASGSEFYRCAQDGEDGHSLLFISPEGSHILRTSEIWFADGTFRTAPDLYSQVYLIFGQLPNGQIIPCAYSLLPDKRSSSYQYVWQTVRDIVNPASPKTILVDFEQAEIKACREVYPEADISGCFFHFKKALEANIGKKGCKKQVNETAKYQKILNYLLALAFVPCEEVNDTWDRVIKPFITEDASELTPEMTSFISYFEANYLGELSRFGRRLKPRIRVNLWNKFKFAVEGQPITNNGAEAFNGSWNRATPANASLWTILDGFRREETLASEKYRCFRQYGSQASENQTRRASELDKRARLQRIVKLYGTYDINMYFNDIMSVITS